jgi:hypothetical protein
MSLLSLIMPYCAPKGGAMEVEKSSEAVYSLLSLFSPTGLRTLPGAPE